MDNAVPASCCTKQSFCDKYGSPLLSLLLVAGRHSTLAA